MICEINQLILLIEGYDFVNKRKDWEELKT